MNHIQLAQVYKTFGQNRVLKGLSLKVEAGTVHALLGSRGSGKSTVLALLAGRVRADGGFVAVLGRTSFVQAAGGAVALIAGTDATNRWLSARQVFEVAAGADEAWDQQMAEEVSRRLALPLDVPLRALPPGAQQCADLAVAAGRRVPVVLLDDPCARMAAAMRQRFLDTVPLLARACRAAVVVTARDLGDVAEIADQGSLLEEGKVLQPISRMELRCGGSVAVPPGSSTEAAFAAAA